MEFLFEEYMMRAMSFFRLWKKKALCIKCIYIYF